MSTPWIGGIRQPDAPVRLFCFPHAGGGAAFFRPWRERLQPEVDVCPVVLPGREARARERPFTRMAALVGPLATALAPYLDRPFAFLGHSLGAVVAYETARRLAGDGGTEPDRLYVSGRRAAHLPASRAALHRRSDADFLAGVAAMGGTPPEVLDQPDLVEFLLPSLRADFELNETYLPLPGAVLSCPVTALTGDRDPEVDEPEVAAWRHLTTGEFDLHVFAGDHFFLRDRAVEVTTVIRHRLDRALHGSPIS